MGAGATPNRKLLAYLLSDGTRLSDQDTLLSQDNHDPQAIWSDGAHVWSSDGDDHVVYAYALDDGSGATISAKHFHPWASIDPPQGLWSDGRVMYMARPGASKVYAYSVTTRAAHFRRDIELDPENTDGGGIWSDGETMWVLDTADAYVYAYDLRYQDSDYEAVTVYRKPSAEFRPSPQNDALGAGFTGHGFRVWIIDATDDPLYTYGLRNTPPTFPQSTVALDISETSGGDNCVGAVPFATDADDDTPSYSLGGPGADRFAFDSGTRQINTAEGTANLQKGDRYSLTVYVTDGKNLLDGSDGSPDDSVGIKVHVWENANSRFRGPSRIGLSFVESIRPGAPVAEIGVSDPDDDELQFSPANVAHGYTSQPFAYEDGRLRLQADKTLNFEHRNHYQLRLSVKDNKDLDGQPHAVWDDSVLIDIYLIKEFVYKTYYFQGDPLGDLALADVYESCEFAEGQRNCEGRLKHSYYEDADTGLESLSFRKIPFSLSGSRLEYTISVPNSISQTRVKATASAESGVTVAISPADSSATKKGH